MFRTIPIFIPEKACPFRCIYCNQYNIASQIEIPQPEEAVGIIEKYLATFPKEGIKKIGFFGGSFTGMSIEEQTRYLKIAQPYLKSGQIESIQLSTRPDYINADILDNLQQYGVRTIELGAQSLDNEVLKKSGRGHTVEEVEQASVLIKQYGFELGLQMMVGLPGDSFEKSMLTAKTIAKFKADYTRIYPTLVIKDTDLEKLYLAGQYTPLSLEEAVRWSKELLKFFTFHHITILRMGLHPSEGLLTGSSLVAGPFHISFRELVLTSLFEELIFSKINQDKKEKIIIRVSPKQINAAIGYYSQNRNKLETIFKDVKFKTDETLKKGCLTIEYE